MNTQFVHRLEVVTTFHAALLAVLFCLPLFSHILSWSGPQTFIPVDFTVVVPDTSSSTMDEVNKILKQHHDVAITDPDSKSKPKPPKDREKKDSKLAANLGPPSKNPRGKPLSAAEIKRLLALGARPGEENIIPPNEESMCFVMIKRAFNDAWAQPSYDEVGNATAQIEVRLRRDGSIFGVRMMKKSGNDVLDASVMQAAMGIKRIDGLTPAFLGKYEEVTIDFKVEPH